MTSWSRQERFTVRLVTSCDNPPASHPSMGPYDTGTYALTTVYRASFNDVLRDRAAFSQQYQTGPVSTSTVGPRDPETGSHEAYRYAWERLTSWGGRVSDTMWITRDKGGRS